MSMFTLPDELRTFLSGFWPATKWQWLAALIVLGWLFNICVRIVLHRRAWTAYMRDKDLREKTARDARRALRRDAEMRSRGGPLRY